MSKNLKTLVGCVLALVFVGGTVVGVAANTTPRIGVEPESVSEDVSGEVASEVASEVVSETATDVETTEAVSEEVSEEESSETSYLMGDVNLDGRITADDARLTLRVSCMLETISGIQSVLADVDENGRITAQDARSILRVSAELEPGFGYVVL